MNNLLSQSAYNRPYLHSDPAYFNANIGALGMKGPQIGYSRKEVEKVSTFLGTLASNAWDKEQQFYSCFKGPNGEPITNAEQWSKYFLRGGGLNPNEETFSQAVISAINNHDLIMALKPSMGSVSNTKVKQKISNELNKIIGGNIVKAMDKVSNDDDFANLIGEILKKEGYMTDTNKIIKDFADYLPSSLLKRLQQQKSIKKTSADSQIVSELKKSFLKQQKSKNEAIKIINDKINAKLTEKGFSKEYIIKAQNAVTDYINQQRAGAQQPDFDIDKMLSGLKNTIGGVEELATGVGINLLTTYDINLPGLDNDVEISASNFGSEIVQRIKGLSGQISADSKVDTIISITRENTTTNFNIQEKNSIIEIYKSFDELYDAEQREQKWIKMGIQSAIKLQTLEEDMMRLSSFSNGGSSIASGTVSEEQMSLLSYLVTNYVVLSNPGIKGVKLNKRIRKGNNAKDSISADRAKQAIANLMSIANVLYMNDVVAIDGAKIDKQIDFYIFKDALLIPASQIYISFMNALNDEVYKLGTSKERVAQSQFSFTTDYNATDFRNGIVNKNIPPKTGMNYTEVGYIQQGFNEGYKAYSNLMVKGVHLEFNTIKHVEEKFKNNLVNLS